MIPCDAECLWYNQLMEAIMTVAQLQELLSNFDPESTVRFGYPATDNYGCQYQARTWTLRVEEQVGPDTGTVSPIIFLNGAEMLED